MQGATLEFNLKLEGKPPLRLRGMIRSAKEKPETRTYFYDVQFAQLRPAEQDAIYSFVVEKQRKELQTRPVAGPAGAQQTKGRAAYRAQKRFPVRFAVVGQPGSNAATALDLSSGGSRVAFHSELREDRGVAFAIYFAVRRARGPDTPRGNRAAKRIRPLFTNERSEGSVVRGDAGPREGLAGCGALKR